MVIEFSMPTIPLWVIIVGICFLYTIATGVALGILTRRGVFDSGDSTDDAGAFAVLVVFWPVFYAILPAYFIGKWASKVGKE